MVDLGRRVFVCFRTENSIKKFMNAIQCKQLYALNNFIVFTNYFLNNGIR